MIRDFVRLFLEASAAKRHGVDLSAQKQEKFEKYLSDPNYFVTYTALDKVGINPRSEYYTPIGIYAYSLQDIGIDALTGKVPWAGNNPYIQVLYSDRGGCVEIDQSGRAIQDDERWMEEAILMLKAQYSVEYLDKGKKIHAAIRDHKDKACGIPKLDQIYQEFLGLVQEFAEQLETMDPQNVWSFVSKMRSISRSFDTTLERLYPTDDDKLAIPEEIREQIGGLFYGLRDLAEPIEGAYARVYSSEKLEKLINLYIKGCYHQTGFGVFWKVTMDQSKNPKRWNRMLRAHGIRGIIDHGAGLIHPHEPAQAVFLDPKSYRHVDQLENPKLKKKR